MAKRDDRQAKKSQEERVLSALSNASIRLFAESNTRLVVGQRPSIVKLSTCALLGRTGRSDQFRKKTAFGL